MGFRLYCKQRLPSSLWLSLTRGVHGWESVCDLSCCLSSQAASYASINLSSGFEGYGIHSPINLFEFLKFNYLYVCNADVCICAQGQRPEEDVEYPVLPFSALRQS